MTYPVRIRFAAAASLFLHVLALAVWAPAPAPDEGFAAQPEPLRVSLAETPRPPARQLVDVREPADKPPEDTRNIAEQNAAARDVTTRDGDREGPVADEPSEFESAPMAPPAPAPAPAVSPVPPQEPAETPPEPAAESAPNPPRPAPKRLAVRDQARAPVASDTKREPDRRDASSEDAAPDEPEPEQDRIQVAQAPQPPTPEAVAGPRPQKRRGQVDNAVRQQGFTNFPAIQDELAPYLREIQRRVDREWREALVTRYSGTSPTRAVVDCEIAPDGKLVSVTLAEAAQDKLYAALCQAAIRQAAPFSPFPFEVPDFYRNRNLEIRWSFSFL